MKKVSKERMVPLLIGALCVPLMLLMRGSVARADSSTQSATTVPPPATPAIRIIKPTVTIDPKDFDGFVPAPVAGGK